MTDGPDIVAIIGPTASGKTRLAVAVAREIGAEIISADSRQVYRRMDLGTGKDLAEYSSGGDAVPVHLVDVVEPGTEFSMFEYQEAFRQAFEKVRGRGAVPLLCGGSGMYLDCILRGYNLQRVPEDEALRAELGQLSDDALVERLKALRELHNVSDSMDRVRLVRAIEIAEHVRGGAESASGLELRSIVFGLRLERSVLRQRIEKRLTQRLQDGMEDEVRSLLDEGITPQQLEFYGLEYRFVTRYVVGELSRNDMIQKLKSSIGRFAKRQETWFRRMERHGVEIEWLDGLLPLASLSEQVVAGFRAAGASS